VWIIYTVESGSRTNKFPSEDNKCDVRMIYHRSENDYPSICKPHGVVERTIDKFLDISGWVLNQTFCLTLGDNLSPADWLTQEIV
jgi:predicted nucleotidyltransferase